MRGFLSTVFWGLFWAGASLPTGWSAGLAVFRLVESAWSLSKCADSAVDCFFGAADIVFGTFVAFYNTANGRRSVDTGDLPNHGVAEFNTSMGVTYIVAHIPPVNGKLYLASISSANNGTWTRHGSAYVGQRLTHHILYRLASPEDLGRPNDGSYHHYRVQSVKNSTSGSNTRRAEDNDSGVVVDYLWKDNDSEPYWCCFRGAAGTLGSNSANWMEENSAEAACVTPTVGDGQGDWDSLDNGVMAYGWNNAPFDFAGRSGGWLDECVGNSGSIDGGCDC